MRFRFEDFEVDEDAFELRRAGDLIEIPPLPLKLLLYLLAEAPKAPSRDELMDALWPGTVVSEASLSRAVRDVRRALGEGARDEGVLQTVRGRGFRVAVAVEKLDDVDPSPEDLDAGSALVPGAESDPFLGRSAELAVGRASVEAAAQGQSRFLLITGEPGIGKTRLAGEIAAEAGRAGARILMGRGHEGEGEPAFWPWSQVLSHYADRRDPKALATELGGAARHVARIVPSLAARLRIEAGEDPSSDRFAFFDGIASFLRRASANRPLVIVFEDLQWVDDSSLLLLDFVARELDGARLLVIATYRDREVSPRPGFARLLDSLARARDATRSLPLEGLSHEEVSRLLAATTGEEAPSGVVDEVHERSGGNPFFIHELVQLSNPGNWSDALDPALPPGVRQVIHRRVDELPGRTRSVLSTAAALGREFRIAVLARACELDTDSVLEALEAAERTRLVAPTGRSGSKLQFSHALVREALYDELSTRERVRLHLRIGLALEALASSGSEDERLSELAHHFGAALPAAPGDKAIDYAIRAAQRDAEQLAFEEAVKHCELGLSVLDEAGDSTGRRCELLEILAEARFRCGDREDAVATLWKLCETAQHVGDDEALAHAVIELSTKIQFSGTGDASTRLVRLARQLLGRLPAGSVRSRALLHAALARQITWGEEASQQESLSREAVALGRKLEDPDLLAQVLTTRVEVLELLSEVDERAVAIEELFELATARGNRLAEADARVLRLQHRIEVAEPRAIGRELDACEALGDELRHPHVVAHVARIRAMRALWRGELEDAEGLVFRAFEVGQASDARLAGAALSGQLGSLRRLQGRSSELEETLRNAADAMPEMVTFRCGLAMLLVESGEPAQLEEAREIFEALCDEDFAALRRSGPHHAWNLAMSAELCHALGDVTRASGLASILEGLRGRYITIPSVATSGCASRYLGLLRATEGAETTARALLDEAIDVERKMGANAFLPLALADRASLGECDDEALLAEARSVAGKG